MKVAEFSLAMKHDLLERIDYWIENEIDEHFKSKLMREKVWLDQCPVHE